MTLSQPENRYPLSKDEALIYDWRIHSIRQALKQKGKATGTLQIQDLLELGHLDQYHYFGTKACDRAINRLALNHNSEVLDIGSGVGGPARYISYKTGCQIQCVELRKDFNEIAQELTKRVGLHQRIQYLTGNILSSQVIDTLSPSSFDSVISFLSFLHIEDRDKILEICFRSLKENGHIYIEDYVANCTLTPEIKTTLKEIVQSSYIPTRETYRQHLERSGFSDICFIDLTTGWKLWVEERYQKFLHSKEESIKIFGEKIYEHRRQFYQTITDLFQSGNIGGSLITAKKPCIPKMNQVSDTYFSSLTSVYSEQYHFFLEDGSLLALRHFQTGTIEHYSAWWSDTKGNSQELLNTTEHRCSNQHISIQKNEQKGTIYLPEANLEIQFKVAAQFTWDVPCEKNHRPVIHQPKLLCTLHTGDRTQKAIGYCKIFQGNYPKFWGYHFVHAVFPDYGIVWSADATFGQEKYNYFKLLNTSQTEKQILLHGEDSFHRSTSAHARIQNKIHHLKFDTKAFATWSSILRNQTSTTMESNLCLEYRPAILEIDDQEVGEGICLKESCFGTII